MELLEDKRTYDARKAEKLEKEIDEKRERRIQGLSISPPDWFMVGDIDTLTQNIAKVTDQLDKNRIIGKIQKMRAEERAERKAAEKKAKEDAKVKVNLWRWDYMVKKRVKLPSECMDKHILPLVSCINAEAKEEKIKLGTV